MRRTEMNNMDHNLMYYSTRSVCPGLECLDDRIDYCA